MKIKCDNNFDCDNCDKDCFAESMQYKNKPLKRNNIEKKDPEEWAWRKRRMDKNGECY